MPTRDAARATVAVQVLYAPTDRPIADGLRRRWLGWLADDESARLRAFRFERHRDAWLTSRALLRWSLARTIGTEPARLRFGVADGGKPVVAAPADRAVPAFNLSHTDGMAAVALSAGGPVGVDVESLERRGLDERLARRYFAVEEADDIERAPPAERALRLLDYWTAKEAWLKATGRGLAMPLDAFAVSLPEGGAPVLTRAPAGEAGAHHWRFAQWRPGGRHVLAACAGVHDGAEAAFELHETDAFRH